MQLLFFLKFGVMTSCHSVLQFVFELSSFWGRENHGLSGSGINNRKCRSVSHAVHTQAPAQHPAPQLQSPVKHD